MIFDFYLSNLVNFAPYGVLLVLYGAIALSSEIGTKKVFIPSVMCLLLLFVGFQDAMTPDMERYRLIYENIGEYNLLSIEPVFFFLSGCLRTLNLSYHSIVFTYTFISLLCVYLGVRSFRISYKVSLLLYVLIPGCFLNMFVEMRQVSAVAITFYAMSILSVEETKSRRRKSIALAILSICFHYSASAYWLVILLLRSFIRKTHNLAIYLSLLISSLVVPTSMVMMILRAMLYPVLPGKFQSQFDWFLQSGENLAQAGQLLKCSIYTLMAGTFTIWLSLSRDKDKLDIPVNLFWIGVILLNLTRGFADATRISYFFLIYQIVIFPRMLVAISKTTWRFLLSYIIIVFYLGQFFWGVFSYSEEVGGYPFLHYQNILLSILR